MICRKITIRRNKFPVLRSTGKTLRKMGKSEPLKRKRIWKFGKSFPFGSNLGQKRLLGNFDPNRG